MKKSSSKKSGSSLLAKSESVILQILERHEKRLANHIPPLELRSRVLQKLHRSSVRSSIHLGILIAKLVEQVLLDHVKRERRHYQRYVYGVAIDGLAPRDAGHEIKERKEELLGPTSPLNGSDKALLQIAFDDPVFFVRGCELNQSRMAVRLGVSERSIGRRWRQILNKVEAWRQGQMDLSL